MWLPDTNVWIKVMNPQYSPVKQRFHQHHPNKLYLCDVVLSELYYGAFKSQRSVTNVALIDALVTQFPSFGFDAKAAKFCGEIRVDLERKGLLIGSYDIQIAATALANNCVLVTHNTREFSRVEGLQIEDWES